MSNFSMKEVHRVILSTYLVSRNWTKTKQ